MILPLLYLPALQSELFGKGSSNFGEQAECKQLLFVVTLPMLSIGFLLEKHLLVCVLHVHHTSNTLWGQSTPHELSSVLGMLQLLSVSLTLQ